jgi:hypothetical protein
MIFHEADEREGWRGLSFDKPSKGVVISDGKRRGMLLWAVGAHLLFEIEECGFWTLEDLGLAKLAPPGVSVWEGRYLWHQGSLEYPMDGDLLPHGTFRPPTSEEWMTALQEKLEGVK